MPIREVEAAHPVDFMRWAQLALAERQMKHMMMGILDEKGIEEELDAYLFGGPDRSTERMIRHKMAEAEKKMASKAGRRIFDGPR